MTDYEIGDHPLKLEDYDKLPVGTRVSDSDDPTWGWEKQEGGRWVNEMANIESFRNVTPEWLSRYHMRVTHLPEGGPYAAPLDGEPTREQLDALYDEGYAKGRVDGVKYVSALSEGAGMDVAVLRQVEAAAKAARLAYWEAMGDPRVSEPREISIKAWAAALRAGVELFAKE